MKSWILSPQVTQLLDALYADALNDDKARASAQAFGAPPRDAREHFQRLRKAYLAIGPEFGRLLYSLGRSARARTIVEFGTSFGVSTIYLASAVRDNGGGKVITTEFEAEKSAQAKKNLEAAGLGGYVEFRVGDAMESLKASPGEIDLIFLDGAKEMYLDVLRLVESRLRPGGLVASDNTDHAGIESFLQYLGDPENGYTTTAILTEGHRGKAHEVSVRN